jgi:nicotinamidase/pyrazinamidase
MPNYNPQEVLVAVIDAQAGFMPIEEGHRLGLAGFGELPVLDGESIVPYINLVSDWAARHAVEIATTQDWHSEETAHFGEGPMQWPVHCVADTPGAQIHPEVTILAGTMHYRKGQDAIAAADEDTSYSGFNAIDDDGETLGAYIERTHKLTVVVVGLALGGKDFDTCVDSSARDFAGIDSVEQVVVIREATRVIVPNEQAEIEAKLAAKGVQVIGINELLDGSVIAIR